MQIPDTAPFSEEQKAVLNQLLPSLNPSQLQWLLGFGAGLEAGMRGAPSTSGESNGAGLTQRVSAQPVAVAPRVPVTVVYGSESGNAETLAHNAAKAARQAGMDVNVLDMGEIGLADMARAKNLLVITSTWGDGEPPENAVQLHASLMGDEVPSFGGVDFAVCSLGDTSYEKFCQTGKDFDRRLEELGGRRFADRVDCDLDFEEPFKQWFDRVLGKLKEKVQSATPDPVTAAIAAPAAATAIAIPAAPSVAPPTASWSRKNPFPGIMKDRVLLNGRGSKKETWHYEISLEGSGMTYQPGDSLAVVPRNAVDVVEGVLKAGNFVRAQVPAEGGSVMSLGAALTSFYDVTGLSRKVLESWNAYAKSSRIDHLLAPENKDALREYLYGRQIVDMLQEFPVEGMVAEDFIKILRKLPPRLYSIASSLKAHPEEVHLTVASVRYHSHGRDRKGVASTWLADDLQTGDTLPVYATANKNFKLPADGDKPIIMVGPGTGVAPFRAFVEERSAVGATGDNWLFFGDQHYTNDFLYQLEWQSYLKDGVLTRLDVAFSRDQKQKIYVQHRMLEKARDIWAWLDRGANFYVCGDASRMAGDVHEALITIAEKEGGKSRSDAEAWVQALQKEKRYQRDVY